MRSEYRQSHLSGGFLLGKLKRWQGTETAGAFLPKQIFRELKTSRTNSNGQEKDKMITNNKIPELRRYRKIEEALPLESAPRFANLVTPLINVDAPVHRWFRYKESFSANLLLQILSELPKSTGKKIRLLDPFCGVGTVLVTSQELSAEGYWIEPIGIERNPFIAFAAKTKLSWQEIKHAQILKLGMKLYERSKSISPEVPELTSLRSGLCMSRHLTKRILALSQTIQETGNNATYRALLLGLASSIEAVSYVRKDGRALRLVERKKRSLRKVLEEKWTAMAEDALYLQNCLVAVPRAKVLVGDGRTPTKLGIAKNSIDLIVTSPPYPNNIDYSEVYKLELWLLEFIKDNSRFLNLRKKTFRSHPTCSEPELPPEFEAAINHGRLADLLQPTLARLSDNPERWRKKVLLGYAGDMWTSLREQYQCLRRGGFTALVVGNSLHGCTDSPYLIATDLILAELGRSIGFKVDNILIARALKRRLSGNHFLRESVVLLRKP